MSRRSTRHVIGPQMSRAVWYVQNHPGTAIMPIGEYLGFTRNRGYGYDPVHRAISARLLRNVPAQAPTRRQYALFTPEQIDALRGLDALAALSGYREPNDDVPPDSEATRRGDYIRDRDKYDC